MSKSRASKTKAAGALIGITKQNKYQFRGATKMVVSQNRMMRRAQKHG